MHPLTERSVLFDQVGILHRITLDTLDFVVEGHNNTTVHPSLDSAKTSRISFCLRSDSAMPIFLSLSTGRAVSSTLVASSVEMRDLTTVEINLDHHSKDVLQKLGKWLETLVSLASLNLRGSLQNTDDFIRGLDPIITLSCSFGFV